MMVKERRAWMKEWKGRFMGVVIDGTNLMSEKETLTILKQNGGNMHALEQIRDRNENMFGADLICHIPISEGGRLGMFLVPVKEGFLSLPYDAVGQYEGELFTLKEAKLLDQGELHFLLKDIETYSTALIHAVQEALKIEKHRKAG